VFVVYSICPSLDCISSYGEAANVMVAFEKGAPVSWKLQMSKSDFHTNDTAENHRKEQH